MAAVSLVDFSSMDAYCTHVEFLGDQLAEVDAPVTKSRLVHKLVGGLPDTYGGIIDYVHNQDPIPPFETVRSRFTLVERTIKNRAKREGGSSTA
ncbi:hypothetical protein BVRB_6g144120 [Beta vulgaris subsp. vulgaris]|uniref:Uncharacterized protein n=1 Tax=Beta vulgaris subsp. vulgaris TaxID=3555 RepID=A0A0J8C7T9_BETVV|nr:hypothetical protein BVRB_6g144120 [Beta vulgaris subsp. vulgaris]